MTIRRIKKEYKKIEAERPYNYLLAYRYAARFYALHEFCYIPVPKRDQFLNFPLTDFEL